MKIRLLIVGTAIIWSCNGVARATEDASTTKAVSIYRVAAGELFAAKRYREFIALCIQWEELTKDFSPSYNLALGLLQIGDLHGSKMKLNEIGTRLVLNSEQREKLNSLSDDIARHEQYYVHIRNQSSGSVILTHKNRYEDFNSKTGETDIRSLNGRSSSTLGLKPEHAAEYLKQLNSTAIYNNGYEVPPPSIHSGSVDLAPSKDE